MTMADKAGEQLSALMDGECDAREAELALRRLAKDDDLQARWQRYFLISEALKNGLPESIDTYFSGRLRNAIDGELPGQPSVALEPPQTRPRPSILASPNWYKPVAGFALAASVAAVMVVGFDTGLSPPDDGGATGAMVNTSALVSTVSGPRRTDASEENSSGVNVNSRLNNYVVNHNEYLSTNSVHGMLPYVRMVGYEPTR